jgi:soluble lytic murein transglycosylase-like protein
MMKTKLARSIGVLLLLVASAVAQSRSDDPKFTLQRERELEPAIVAAASRYGIDARILRMICFVESRFRLNAVSPKGALGPMQFMPETAVRYGLRNANDPNEAIDAAARYLRDLLKKFGGRVDLAVAAYNAGEGAVEAFRTGRPLVLRTGKVINPRGLITGGIPPYPETQAYVTQIMSALSVRPVGRTSVAPANSADRRSVTTLRNFTLDVVAKESLDGIKNKRRSSLTFIDIDGPQ